MAHPQPTYDELLDLFILGLRAQLPEIRSGAGTLARLEGVVYSEHMLVALNFFDAIQRNVTPLNADDDGVAQWGTAIQLDRKGATGARKASALRVNGSVGASLAIGFTLESNGGLQYQNTSGGTIPAAGYIDVDIEAIDTGESTRLDVGTPLTFTAPPVNIDQSAYLVRALDEGGTDEEPIGEWRERVNAVWVEKRQGGNQTDYEQWALEIDYIQRGYVYANKPSPGYVSMVGLKDGTGDAKVLTSLQRTELLDKLNEERPITDQVIVMETPTRAVHGEVLVTQLPTYAFDFADPVGGLTVDTYDAATRTMTTNETLPSDLAAGNILTIESLDPDVSGANGKPVIVASVTGANTFVIGPVNGSDDPLNFTPATNDEIWAGSRPIYDSWLAVNEYVESMGPANPGFVYGDWTSDLRESAIDGVVDAVDGIALSTTTITGAVGNRVDAVEFSFPDTNLVELLISGQWIIKRA